MREPVRVGCLQDRPRLTHETRSSDGAPFDRSKGYEIRVYGWRTQREDAGAIVRADRRIGWTWRRTPSVWLPALALSAGKGTGSTPTLAKPPIKLRNPIAGGPAQATGGQDHEHAAS